MARRGAITYDGLPISSGGAHSLRHNGFVKTFEALQNFVNSISLQREASSVTLELFDSGDGGYTHFLALSSEFDSKFRRKQGRQIGEYHGHQWEVNPIDLGSLIHELERLRPIPNAEYAGRSLVVHVYWNLIIADSHGGPLPFQTRDEHLQYDIDYKRYLGESFMYARISETSTASLFLSLPLEAVTESALELVKRIQEHFPARLSSKHWKQWTLAKNGKSYVGRKIPGLI